eukprot:6278848-Pyramimonas_sp.AAC.1
MQNLLCDPSVSCLIRPPEYGRDIFKWVYREGNAEADEMTWNARTGNCGLWHDDDFLKFIKLNAVLIDCIRGSFDGGRSQHGV